MSADIITIIKVYAGLALVVAFLIVVGVLCAMHYTGALRWAVALLG